MNWHAIGQGATIIVAILLYLWIFRIYVKDAADDDSELYL